MLNLCFALWCLLGTAPENQLNPPPVSLFIGHEFISPGRYHENVLFLEQYRIMGGIVQSPEGLIATGGYFPLQLGFHRVSMDGGVSLSSHPLPVGGTHANWMARMKVKLHSNIFFEWWHFSNGGVAPNPSVDAWGIGLRF